MVRRAGRCARGRPGGGGGLGLHGRVWRALGRDGGPDHWLPARGRDRLPRTDLSVVLLLGRARSLERGEGPLSKEQVQRYAMPRRGIPLCRAEQNQATGRRTFRPLERPLAEALAN